MSLVRLRLAQAFPILAAITLVAFTGCASTTVIQSQPPGASVLIDGVQVGITPYTMSDTKIVGSTTMVRLEYPGYQPLDVITRNEEFDVLALIGGVFVLVPFLWMMKYQGMHQFELQPAYAGPPGAFGAPAGYAPPAGYTPPPAGPGPAGYPAPPPATRRPPSEPPAAARIAAARGKETPRTPGSDSEYSGPGVLLSSS